MNDRKVNDRFPLRLARFVGSIAWGLMLVTMAPAMGAAAVFCGDLENESIERLTGCALGSETLEGLLQSVFESGGTPLLISMPSEIEPAPSSRPHPSVLIINPESYVDEADPDVDADGEGAAPPLLPDEAVASGQTEADAQSFYSDEDWYYLNLNSDGTYLFFDEPKPDELATEEFSLEEQIPNRIGFGKSWRF